MTAGSNKPWYAIGFFTYCAADSESFAAYRQYALFMARILASLFGARLHWGKYFPLDFHSVKWQYNDLKEFRELCGKFDPGGVFRNEYTSRVLGFDNKRESQGVSVTDNVQRNTTL